MRLFVAITLPDAVQRTIFAAARPLHRLAPEIRWVGPDALHITMKFLGEVSEERVPALHAALQAAAPATAAFTLVLGGIGGFPNLRRPRVLWLGVKNGTGLRRLHAALERELFALGYPLETRPYAPHVTIGRVGPDRSTARLAQVERAAAEVKYDAMVDVRSLELMRSRLSPQGARYEVVASAPLHEVTGDE